MLSGADFRHVVTLLGEQGADDIAWSEACADPHRIGRRTVRGLTKAQRAETLFPNGGYAPSGNYRVNAGSGRSHPADGMTAEVSFGGGAYGTIINPQSFENGGPEWVLRYGNPLGIRYTVASLLETFDYLLSDEITTQEAIRRLRTMRDVRRALSGDKT